MPAALQMYFHSSKQRECVATKSAHPLATTPLPKASKGFQRLQVALTSPAPCASTRLSELQGLPGVFPHPLTAQGVYQPSMSIRE